VPPDRQETLTRYRPTGSKELELVRDSGWTAWPPRLPGQPIFYPVLNEDYAIQIARDWNAKDPSTGGTAATLLGFKFVQRTWLDMM